MMEARRKERKKKRFLIISAFIFVLLMVYLSINKRIGFSVPLFDETSESFTLKPGDLLVRPNLNWLPGSSKVVSGRNFGHVAIVVEGAEGNTLDEAMAKAMVIESVIFDQATRTFILDKQKQLRKVPAIISFGRRFEGIRYRLRMDLDESEREQLLKFLFQKPGNSGYNLFSTKMKAESQLAGTANGSKNNEHWNCATLVWFSVLLVSGDDIDSNKGFWVYPNDIIRSQHFNSSGGRMRF